MSGRRTLYVTAPGTVVQCDRRALRIRRPDGEAVHAPLGTIGRLVVWAGVVLTTPALFRLARAGVDVALVSSRGRYVAAVTPPLAGSAVLRIAQVQRHLDAAFCVAFARRLVADKCAAQSHLLRQARERGASGALLEAARAIDTGADDATRAETLDIVRGHEGAASRAYFRAWAELLRPPWRFEGRNRRPPRDPVNALLSLGYTMLTHELRADLEARGLDPRLGFLHGVRAGRPALALDLIEPWRAPAVDRLVATVLNRRAMKPGDFEPVNGGVLLSPSALTRFFDHYERHLGPRASDAERPGLRHRMSAWLDGVERRILEGDP